MEVLRLGVLPVYRRHGLGKLLVANLRHNAQYHVLPEIRVTVPDIHCRPGDPDDVSVFLRKMGFEASGVEHEWKSMYGEVVDGYTFVARV